MRDVTTGFDKRNINRKKIAIIKNKKMQYSQQLVVKRGDEYRSIVVFVNHRIKKHRKTKTRELILKPKYIGDTIRL